MLKIDTRPPKTASVRSRQDLVDTPIGPFLLQLRYSYYVRRQARRVLLSTQVLISVHLPQPCQYLSDLSLTCEPRDSRSNDYAEPV